jgi:methylated-DNA-[protein]-cysteine S-methyltransferase
VKATISQRSPIGPISITWDSATATIDRIGIGDRCAPATRGAAKASAPASVAVLQGQLEAYFSDSDFTFTVDFLSLNSLTAFQRRVVNCVCAIPSGRTRSYAEIAADAGSPGAARAVGRVMASNRYPIVIPCHRVITSGGGLGGYSGGLKIKRALLCFEREQEFTLTREFAASRTPALAI